MIVAATGVSLVAMVARICLESDAYAAHHARLRRVVVRSEELRSQIDEARIADEAAYARVVETMALPKAELDQRQLRTARLQEALFAAAEAPLNGAQLSLAVLHLALDVLGVHNPNLVSDVGCAAEFGASAVFACGYNVRINHRYMKNAAAIATQSERIDRYEREARAMLAVLRARVRQTLNS
jgi:formiminotetrahydrofolate cyclodeaminase